MNLEKLKQGKTIQRVIDYCGQRLVEHFQPNKDIPNTYDRYFMPINRDKSQAIQQNYALELSEVERIINKTETNLSILVI